MFFYKWRRDGGGIKPPSAHREKCLEVKTYGYYYILLYVFWFFFFHKDPRIQYCIIYLNFFTPTPKKNVRLRGCNDAIHTSVRLLPDTNRPYNTCTARDVACTFVRCTHAHKTHSTDSFHFWTGLLRVRVFSEPLNGTTGARAPDSSAPRLHAVRAVCGIYNTG